MPISSGRNNKVPLSRATDLPTQWISELPLAGQSKNPDSRLASKAPARLVDLRSPEVFRMGFIPGSYSVSDLRCWKAARNSGLFTGREIYFLADDPEQLALFHEFGDLGAGSDLAGWFGPDALHEWRKVSKEIGQLEAIDSNTLGIRLAGWNMLALDIVDDAAGSKIVTLSHPTALRFCLQEIPVSLDGLPLETSICITASSLAMSSFAASLMWNFGFHKISYLTT